MPILLEDTTEVTIRVEGEPVTAYFPGQSTPEMQQAVKELLQGRFRQKSRGKIENRLMEARTRFFDKMCQRIEGVQYRAPDGSIQDLTENTEDWQQRIPINWKTTIVAYFEEQEVLSDEEVEDLNDASE